MADDSTKNGSGDSKPTDNGTALQKPVKQWSADDAANSITLKNHATQADAVAANKAQPAPAAQTIHYIQLQPNQFKNPTDRQLFMQRQVVDKGLRTGSADYNEIQAVGEGGKKGHWDTVVGVATYIIDHDPEWKTLHPDWAKPYKDKAGHVYTGNRAAVYHALDAIIQLNGFTDVHGEDCVGNPLKHPNIVRGEVVKIPVVSQELVNMNWAGCVLCGDIPPLKPLEAAPPPVQLAPPPPPPPPAPIVTQVREEMPHEYFRQDAPSQNPRAWPVGSTMNALELAARTGLLNKDKDGVSKFSAEYYALKNVAARHSAVAEKDSGEMGSNVDGNITGDFQQPGDHMLGEDSESRKDDASRDIDHTTGEGGLIGKEITGPRQHGFVTGHIEKVGEDGTLYRDEHMPLEFAHGGNYAYDALGAQIHVGNMLGLPVGVLDIAPDKQTVLDSETQRWGLAQPNAVQAKVNEAGFNNLFRDQQTTLSGPLESPDRIYAYTFGMNAKQEFLNGMRAMDAAKTPQDKQAAAVHALNAYRDLQDNFMVKRVDSYRIPMQKDLDAVRNYMQTQGIDLTAADAAVSTAPRLLPHDMDVEDLRKMQDYHGLKDSRYEGIGRDPNITKAYAAALQYVYRPMNSFEAYVARGGENAAGLPAAEKTAAMRGAIETLMAGKDTNRAVADAMNSNPNLGIQVISAVHDMPRNYAAYGFKSQDDAQAYVDSLTRGDKTAQKQLDRNGDTTPLPVLGQDDRFADDEPKAVVPVIAKTFAENPAVFHEFLDRISNPAYHTQKNGKSDDVPYATGFLGAYGAERPQAGAAEAADTQNYTNLYTSLGLTKGSDGEKALFKAVTKAAISRENGAGGLSMQAKQDLDNRMTHAQQVKEGAVVVTSDADIQKIKDSGQGGTVQIVRGDARDQGIAAAVTSNDVHGLYNQLLDSDGARVTGSQRASVAGLAEHPGLARDAVVLAILRDPNAFDGVIKELEDMDESVQGDKYGDLADALRSAKNHAKKYQKKGDQKDLDNAVRAIGGFFANMETNSSNSGGAWRFNAWNVMLNAAAQDQHASTAIVEAVGSDAQMRAAAIKFIPSLVAADDGVRPQNEGKVGEGNQLPSDIDGSADYASRFFTLARNSDGKVLGTGLFGRRYGRIGVDDTTLTSLLPPHVAAQAAQAATSLNSSGVDTQNGVLSTGQKTTADAAMNNALGTTQVFYLPTTAGANQVKTVAAWMKNTGNPLPTNVTSYEQLAADSISSGAIKVTNQADQLTVSIDTTNLDTTLAAGGRLDAAPGVALWWAAFFIHGGGKTPPNNPKIPQGPIPGCPDGRQCIEVPPPPSTPPLPPVFTQPIVGG